VAHAGEIGAEGRPADLIERGGERAGGGRGGNRLGARLFFVKRVAIVVYLGAWR